MLTRRLLLGALAASGAVSHVRTARAQDYPSRNVRIVVPFAAGSATDNGARHIAEGLTKKWNATVIVENKPGANGAIAAQDVVRSKPDGHTIFVASNTAVASNVAMFKSLPYDPITQLEPVTSIGFAPTFLVAHPSVPAKSLPELIALAKASPGKINFGSGSASTHMSGEMLKARAGIDINHIPYRSTPLALQDLLGGHIQIMFADPVTSIPQVRAGKINCLGVATNERYKLTPELPTLKEQGIGDFELYTWTTVFLPVGVPRPVYDTIRTAVVEVINDPAYVERQAKNGAEVRTVSPEEMRRIQLAEIQLYRDLMKGAGIEPE